MGWIAEEGTGVRLLHDLAGVHHRDPVAHLGHHPKVVCDEEHGGSGPALKATEQLQDLGLDADVERGRRLVGDQQIGRAGQSHGDHRPLAQAAGELMREGLGPAFGIRYAHCPQEIDRPLPG